jgi:hypothetical protein
MGAKIRELLRKIGITQIKDYETKDFFTVSYLLPITAKILRQTITKENK